MENKEQRSLKSSGAVAVFLTGSRTLFALLTQKLIAMWLGPSGLAQLGQFQTVWMLFQSLSTGGGQDGLVKLTAEQKDPHTSKIPLAAFSAFTMITGAVLSVLLFLSSPHIITHLELPPDWLIALRISALLIFFSGPCTCLQSWFMGRGMWGSLISIQTITSLSPLVILGLVFYTPMDINTMSPLIFSLPPVISIMCLSLFNFFRATKFFFKHLINFSALKTFWPAYRRLAVMALPAVVVSPVSLIAARQILARNEGWEVTGLYQALLRFFNYPILLFTTFLSVYYLPALGRSVGFKAREWKYHTLRVFLVLLVLCFFLALIGPAQKTLLRLLYTDDIIVPFTWYYAFVLTTFIKLWVWLLSMQLFILEAWKSYWIVELQSAVIWISLTALLVPALGVEGILISSIVELIISLILLYLILPKIRKRKYSTLISQNSSIA
ncbi:Lipopolysaccharide biosynthesis protein [Chitinispirillum alkaliphilum]|nr:Lipopolysaccharide biosynthesis protein [Chitinispirillum alkaliphilum]